MLRVKITELGSVSVLYVKGRMVRGETCELRKAVLAKPDRSVVVLDLSGVGTIDAAGLGLLLEMRQHTESRGVEFRLQNVSRLVKQVMEITRLDRVFEMTIKCDLSITPLRKRPMLLTACAWR